MSPSIYTSTQNMYLFTEKELVCTFMNWSVNGRMHSRFSNQFINSKLITNKYCSQFWQINHFVKIFFNFYDFCHFFQYWHILRILKFLEISGNFLLAHTLKIIFRIFSTLNSVNYKKNPVILMYLLISCHFRN